MSAPLVSVKMITYNHVPYIRKAIEGVLQQKVDFSFELVIGEDCSTDGTREIVFDYQKKYPDIIKVITSEKNVGARQNSLRTAEACEGKYIAFCEGDDFWHRKDKLKLQVDILESHPEYGLVYSDYDLHNVSKGKTITDYCKKVKGITIQTPDINDILADKSGLITCTITARKELMQRIIEADPFLHKSSHFKMGDTQLWAEISLYSKLYRINDSLATHNIFPESATNSKDKRKIINFWISNSEMCVYLCNKHNLSSAIKDQHLKCIQRRKLRLALYEKNHDYAKSIINDYNKLSMKNLIWYCALRNRIIGYIMIAYLKILRRD